MEAECFTCVVMRDIWGRKIFTLGRQNPMRGWEQSMSMSLRAIPFISVRDSGPYLLGPSLKSRGVLYPRQRRHGHSTWGSPAAQSRALTLILFEYSDVHFIRPICFEAGVGRESDVWCVTNRVLDRAD
jgi:hypothetical protein